MGYESGEAILLAKAILRSVQDEEAPGDGETWTRAAIARSYYALFSEARLLGFEGTRKERRALGQTHHRNVQHELRVAGAPKLAEDLNVLHELRKQADYDLDKEVSAARAVVAVELAAAHRRTLRRLAKRRARASSR